MLPAPHRLKGRKDFNDLFRKGRFFSNDVLMLKVAAGEKRDNPSQFGFGVSTKFSKKAVERNKTRRWMREAVRGMLAGIQPGKKIILLVNPRFPKNELNANLIQKKTENLLKKAKIL
jgi:ribonuclease P protein component